MPLHLIKLAVGCESVKELKGWVAERIRTAKEKGLPRHHIHITRMTPKRVDEVLDGGSIYWVIRGEIAAREKIIAIEPFRDRDGIGRCRLMMQPKVIAVLPRPMRAFQGWRYFVHGDVPPDVGSAGAGVAAMPEPLRRELRELGLLLERASAFSSERGSERSGREDRKRVNSDGGSPVWWLGFGIPSTMSSSSGLKAMSRRYIRNCSPNSVVRPSRRSFGYIGC